MDNVTKYEEENNILVDQIVLVAHNGKSFDLPFLLHALKTAGIWDYWDYHKDKLFILDTLHLSRKILNKKTNTFQIIDYQQYMNMLRVIL